MILKKALFRLFEIAYSESVLSKPNKDDHICITLHMQKKLNSVLSDMKNELSDIKAN